MKALSIRQPWASMIAHGLKKIETRTWQTNYRGDLLICAGAKPDDWLIQRPATVHPIRGVWCDAREPGDEDFENFYPFGQAIAIAELHSIEPMTREHELDACCEIYPGAFAWHLRNILPIKPFAVKGQLSLFEVDFKKIIDEKIHKK